MNFTYALRSDSGDCFQTPKYGVEFSSSGTLNHLFVNENLKEPYKLFVGSDANEVWYVNQNLNVIISDNKNALFAEIIRRNEKLAAVLTAEAMHLKSVIGSEF